MSATEKRDPPLSEATRDELVKALKDSIYAADADIFDADTWLINAFDIALPEADEDDPEFNADDLAAIRDAYEIVAKNASEAHTRNFYEAFRGRIDLLSPSTIRRLSR